MTKNVESTKTSYPEPSIEHDMQIADKATAVMSILFFSMDFYCFRAASQLTTHVDINQAKITVEP